MKFDLSTSVTQLFYSRLKWIRYHWMHNLLTFVNKYYSFQINKQKSIIQAAICVIYHRLKHKLISTGQISTFALYKLCLINNSEALLWTSLFSFRVAGEETRDLVIILSEGRNSDALTLGPAFYIKVKRELFN